MLRLYSAKHNGVTPRQTPTSFDRSTVLTRTLPPSECRSENQDAIASRIAEFVGTITSYDLSVDELRLLLDSLTAVQNTWVRGCYVS